MPDLIFTRRSPVTGASIQFTLSETGAATLIEGGVSKTGKWTAKSTDRKNQITITGDGIDLEPIPVVYELVQKRPSRNHLKVNIASDDDGTSAAVLFEGKLKADDFKDIEYQVSPALSFFMYGELSLDATYEHLILTTPENNEIRIEGMLSVVQSKKASLDERDLLVFTTFTTFAQADGTVGSIPASIAIPGLVEPQGNELVFAGKANGNGTFNVVLAGRYKFVNGALQIFRDIDGITTAVASVAGEFHYNGVKGKWGVTIGSSGKKLDLGARLDFSAPSVGKNGDIKIIGSVGVSVTKDGSKQGFDAELSLSTTATFENGVLVFNLQGARVNGQPKLVLAGTWEGRRDEKLTFALGVESGSATLGLDYSRRDLRAAIRIITNRERGIDVAVSWSVRVRIGDDNKMTLSPVSR